MKRPGSQHIRSAEFHKGGISHLGQMGGTAGIARQRAPRRDLQEPEHNHVSEPGDLRTSPWNRVLQRTCLRDGQPWALSPSAVSPTAAQVRSYLHAQGILGSHDQSRRASFPGEGHLGWLWRPKRRSSGTGRGERHFQLRGLVNKGKGV